MKPRTVTREHVTRKLAALKIEPLYLPEGRTVSRFYLYDLAEVKPVLAALGNTWDCVQCRKSGSELHLSFCVYR